MLASEHFADTFKDMLARTVKTTYDDGSSAQTLYGVGAPIVAPVGMDIDTSTNGSEGTIDEGWRGVPAGWRLEVRIETVRVLTPTRRAITLRW
jgi:hypothetical protein